MRRQQEALMLPHVPGQRRLQFLALLLHAPAPQFRHRFGARLPLHQGGEHRLRRDSLQVGRHCRQLDVRALQHLLDPVHHPGALRHQVRPLPRQVAQVPLFPAGHEAGFQQPVPQQIGQPLGVLDVGLAARHLLHVAGIDQQQLDVPFQQIVDRLPVLAGALHGHVGHAPRLQPGQQAQQLGGGGPEALDLLLFSPAGQGAEAAGNDTGLVDIQRRAAMIQPFHGALRDRGPAGHPLQGNLLCVLPSKGGDNACGSRMPGSDSCAGSKHQCSDDLVTGQLQPITGAGAGQAGERSGALPLFMPAWRREAAA